MDTFHTQEVKELQKELKHIDERGKKKCTLCRAVFVGSLTVFLLVLAYALYIKFNKGPTLEPLPASQFPPPSVAEMQQHVFNLGRSIHPEVGTTSSSFSAKSAPTKRK